MGVVDCTTKRVDQVSWRTAISYLRVILTFVPACTNHIKVYGSRYYLIAVNRIGMLPRQLPASDLPTRLRARCSPSWHLL